MGRGNARWEGGMRGGEGGKGNERWRGWEGGMKGGEGGKGE